MPARDSSHLPVTEQDLSKNLDHANALLTKVSWKPKAPSSGSAPKSEEGRWRPSTDYSSPASESSVSLVKIAKHVSKDPLLLTDNVNHTLTVVRRGIMLGLHIARAYGQAAGLERLVQQNRLGRLTQAQQTEFYDKHHASSAVGLFSASAFIRWQLEQFESEELAGKVMEFPGIPEVDLSNPLKSMECAVFYFGSMVQSSGIVNTDLDLVKFASLYFEAMAEEVRSRANSLRHCEFFTEVSYQLEGSEFVLEGFADMASASVATVEFNRVRFDDIVGNRAAKHEAKRLAQRLACYDPAVGRNPFMELGSMSLVRMGYGKPGTGKSLQIAATATLLDEYCQKLGLPFLFWPLPDNLISTFQGGSAERAVSWMKRIQDPDKVIYAPIDDAENNFEERSRQGVSAGVREVIGVFLRYTEGAYAIRRGNAVLEFFTNLPEQIDRAVLSRVQARFPINGAESREDFLDQDHLWWRKLESIREGFVAMKDPADYEYLSAQSSFASLGDLEKTQEQELGLNDERLASRLASLETEHQVGEQEYFAKLYQGVLEVYPFFSSRDVRNIQQQVSNRITDFDMPDEWFEDTELFFGQSYERRVEMLRDLMRENMKGLSFSEIRQREVFKYLNSLAEIANADREREIERLMHSMEYQGEAARRLERKSGA
ncbi:AAA family ATPase [Pelagicoccus sp. SDUM812005]|uniref:AAA family ATPase n=1 Tax=Pelagicoccus sp. SDUM812005 TaxID=3041257 RepID=UPI0028104DBD|nr:AAA family ATPase [Pelagicoccus sp. SDUM812005]MDQ8181382.1 AAA family ATPase [Pelagicoccus sp. SDUM812005]